MEIGIDEIDDFSEDDLLDTTTQDTSEQILEDSSQDESQWNQEESLEESLEEPSTTESNNDDIIESLLKSQGIEDKSKIKFENEEGETEEIDWDSLDNETKLNILRQSNPDDTDLDDEEIELINSVRRSQLSPAEYIQYIQQDSINRYIQGNQNNISYKVNDFSDDELFLSDFMTRTGATEEEATEALEKAKTNETLFIKQINAIRSEYQKSEDELNKYNEFKQQEEAQQQFYQFTEGVKNQILDFTEFAGYDLNMNNEDMQELYEFITGFDPAGNSYFGKALNDPQTLVKMAWFALNGEQMIQDINEYYKKEIADVRKKSYDKGLQASKDKPKIVHKNITKSKSQVYDDLDNF